LPSGRTPTIDVIAVEMRPDLLAQHGENPSDWPSRRAVKTT
jgi:hypothetical protein